uniref:Sodefrin-like factor n=1 Tax=Parascaris univalens TaxID=6257 RepID=A0A915B716_PARUN
VVESLQCISCRAENAICDDENYCTTAENGYCVFQQQLDAYGNVLSTIKACHTENYIRAGDILVTQIGSCINTDVSGSGTIYRTYLCNNTDMCNIDCVDNILSTTSTTMLRTSSKRALICYSCDQEAENCFNGSCNTHSDGYCLFERQKLNVGGAIRYRSIKRCLSTAHALSPRGSIITTTNQCVQSVDANDNQYFTLLCNTSNLCNSDCIVSTNTPSNIVSTNTPSNIVSTTTTSSATRRAILIWIVFLLSLISIV